jgi:hypothetical protein
LQKKCSPLVKVLVFPNVAAVGSTMLTPGFSPLKILRVRSQHDLFGQAFRGFPRVSFVLSQGWFPYEYRYRIGLVVFLVSETKVCLGFMDRERCLYIVYSLLLRRQRLKVRMAVLITYSESV